MLAFYSFSYQVGRYQSKIYHSSAHWLLVFGSIALVTTVIGACAGSSQVGLLLQPKYKEVSLCIYLQILFPEQGESLCTGPGRHRIISFDVGILLYLGKMSTSDQ